MNVCGIQVFLWLCGVVFPSVDHFLVSHNHGGALPCWKLAVKSAGRVFRSFVCLYVCGSFSWVDDWHDWMLMCV